LIYSDPAQSPLRYNSGVECDPARDIVVGLGANVGPCVENLVRARRALAELGALQASSRLYKTAPIGPAQPDFYNAAVLLRTLLSAETLLKECLGIERHLGRVRDLRWGPRLIDLDLLWARELSVESESLRLPHPRLTERAFALLPLLDVAPQAGHAGVLYSSLRQPLAAQRCEPVADDRW
jgi:2-amino-4-hydroxy-6-hydroxymethyldihydropteridine diphosphokinase